MKNFKNNKSVGEILTASDSGLLIQWLRIISKAPKFTFAISMNIVDHRSVLIYFLGFLILSVYGLVYPAKGQESDVITVKVKENQNIRDLAEEYLHDSDRCGRA